MKIYTVEIRGAKSKEEAAKIKAIVGGALALPNREQKHLEVFLIEREESALESEEKSAE